MHDIVCVWGEGGWGEVDWLFQTCGIIMMAIMSKILPYIVMRKQLSVCSGIRKQYYNV